MSNQVFPALVRGLTWTVTKTLMNSTDTVKAASGFSNRLALWQNPMWKWQLVYDYLWDDPGNIAAGLTYTDLKTLMGFMMARQMDFDDFLFDDPNDDAVIAQAMQLVNDGAGTYYTPVQRNMGGQFFEDVTDLNGAISVYDNGVLKTLGTDYTLVGPGLAIPGYSFMGMVVKWGGSGSYVPTGPVTATFNFYFRVHFSDATQDYENFAALLWTIGGGESKNGQSVLSLESSRIAAL